MKIFRLFYLKKMNKNLIEIERTILCELNNYIYLKNLKNCTLYFSKLNLTFTSVYQLKLFSQTTRIKRVRILFEDISDPHIAVLVCLIQLCFDLGCISSRLYIKLQSLVINHIKFFIYFVFCDITLKIEERKRTFLRFKVQ